MANHELGGQYSYKRDLRPQTQSVEFHTFTQIRRFVDPSAFDEEWKACLDDLGMRNPGFKKLPIGVLACTYANNNEITRMLGRRYQYFGKDLHRTKELQERLGTLVDNFTIDEEPEPVKIGPYFILMGDRLALEIRNHGNISDHRRRLFGVIAKELKVNVGEIRPRKPHISVMRMRSSSREHRTINQQVVFPAKMLIMPPTVNQQIEIIAQAKTYRR